METNSSTTSMPSSDCPDVPTANKQIISLAIFDHMPDVCYATDSSWRLLYANRCAEQWLHADGGGTILGMELWDGMPEAERSICREKLYAAIGQHTSIRWEMYCHGLSIWVDATATPMDNGTLLVCYHDVSQYKRAEDALRQEKESLGQSEKLYRTVFETSTEGIVVSKPEGGLLLANQRMADLLGCSLEELRGKSSMDFTDASQHPQARETRQCLQQGNVQHGEFAYRSRDGSTGWMMYNASPLFDEQGKHIGNFAMHTDITDRKRAEQELIDGANRLRSLLAGMTDAYYFIDREWRFQEINSRGQAVLFDRSREELLGAVVWDLYPQAVGNTAWVHYHQAMDDGLPRHFETQSIVNKRFYAYHVYPQKDGLAIYLSDIHERKLAEDSLRKSADILKQQNDMLHWINNVHSESMVCPSMETLSGACLRIVLEATGSALGSIGKVTENKQYHNIALSEDAWAQCSLSSPDQLRSLNQLITAGLYGILLRDSQTILANDLTTPPYRIELPEGHPAIVNCMAVPFVENGRVAGLIAVANRPGGYARQQQEVLEALTPAVLEVLLRKRAEEVLTAQRLALQALGDNLAVEVETLRRLHEVTIRFFHHSEKSKLYDDILRTAIDLTAADCGDIQNVCCDGNLEMISNSGLSQNCLDCLLITDDTSSTCRVAGEQKRRIIVEDIAHSPHIRVSCTLQCYLDEGIRCTQSTPIVGCNGSLLGILSTHYSKPHVFTERESRVLDLLTRQAADMLQREKMEEELKSQAELLQAQARELEIKSKFITDFFINISHEFKTPLAIMLLGIDLLQEKVRRKGLPVDFSKNLDSMRQNAYRLNRLVGNLLDITKLDAGFMEPDWENIDIIEQTAAIVKYTQPIAVQRGVRLTFRSNADCMVMATDSFMLERILLNLLSNAIKHTPRGGEITVECSAREDQIVLRVRDSGDGIPAEKRSIIFDRFQQVNPSLTRSSEGCGIGLSLCKSLAELLGGEISFESEPGVGSEFFVTLPVLQIDKVPKGSRKSATELAKRLQMEFADIQ